MTVRPSRVLMWPGRVPPKEIRRLLTALIVLFAGASLAITLASGLGPPALPVTVLASLAGAGLGLWLARSCDVPRPAGALVLILLAAAALLATAFVLSGQPMTVFATGLPFAVVIAWQRPVWPSLVIASAAIGAAVLLRAAQEGGSSPATETIVMTVLLGAQTIGFAGAHVGWHMQRRLDQHDADQRDLALTRERLRFATDLHDIQGHTLLAIKLKAELARRSVERDPGVARAELQAIEELAAEADRRTRDLAEGYRTLALAVELANVEQLLGAAGIEVTLQRSGMPPPEHEQTFAALARESASNILRHTAATTVRIHLSDTTMVLENDGADPRTVVTDGRGTGLTGLHQRFAGHGGSFTWQHDGDRFTVTGEIGARS
ncbi:sensor histidine kinase [Brachybacterium hainanense]|uniref:Sensor histidine kinase n=1 Tax=Brachybacterium hainanense TaxID=1541174 RepID=A0ABV6R9Z6_9MICO